MFLANGRTNGRSEKHTDRQTRRLTVALSNLANAPDKVTYRLVTTIRPDNTCVGTSAVIKVSFDIHVPNITVRFRIA
jgi:spore germination protein GerM